MRMKCKDPKVKVLKIMVEKTQFEVGFPDRDTIDDAEVMALASSYSKGKSIVTRDFHLTCNIIRWEIISP